MFKFLAQEYVSQYGFLNLFNFITFRVGASILTSLFFSLIFGQFIINKLSKIQPNGQPIRNDGPQTHIIKKAGTPTMGGVLIILSVFFSSVLWADLQNTFIWIGLLALLVFGFIGFNENFNVAMGPTFDCDYDNQLPSYSNVSGPEEACSIAFDIDGASSDYWEATVCQDFGQWTMYECI